MSNTAILTIATLYVALSGFLSSAYNPFLRYQIFYSISFGLSILYAIVITSAVQATIYSLDSIAVENQQKWGFGQMVSNASVGLVVGNQLVNYSIAVGTVNPSIPRYRHWYKRCKSPVVS